MAGEIFNKLYSTDIYAANRLLLDFDQDAIDELEKSGNYPNLFTESLQTDLYRRRIGRLGGLFWTESGKQNVLNRIVEFHKQSGIPWSKIYRIAEIKSDEDDPHSYKLLERLLAKIAENDDVEAVKILEGLNYNPFYGDVRIDEGRHFTRHLHLIMIFAKFQSKNIVLYLVKSPEEYETQLLAREISEWNDINFIREYVPLQINKSAMIAFKKYGNKKTFKENVEEAKQQVLSSIFDTSLGVILYLYQQGYHFDGEQMASIAADPNLRYLIPVLLSHGSDPVDRDFYELEYGEEYEE